MADENKDKRRAIDMALGQIERRFGKGSIMKLGDRTTLRVPVISSGSIGTDAAMGIGGYPRGRVVEIYGPESSGKTTLALHAIAEAQKTGGTAAFIDAEHAMDAEYSRNLGVDIDALLVSQPDSGEQALEIGEMLVRSGAIDILVVDSVAALVPSAELEGEMGDSFVGLHARLMSKAMRKLTAIVSKSNTCLIFINQIREKIGVMFGSPETTTGGRALKFYSSVRVDIRRIGAIKEGGTDDWKSDQGENRQEQDGASLSPGGVRHHVRPGHLEKRRNPGPRCQQPGSRKERFLVFLRWGAAGSGTGELQAVSPREP